MIKITKNTDGSGTMTIDIKGNAEEIAQEYAALTLKLNDTWPIILSRAQWYLEDILELRKEVDNDKTDKHNNR